MSNEERGARIFNENAQSAFATKEWVLKCLESECQAAANEVRVGFYKAEARFSVMGKVVSDEEVKRQFKGARRTKP